MYIWSLTKQKQTVSRSHLLIQLPINSPTAVFFFYKCLLQNPHFLCLALSTTTLIFCPQPSSHISRKNKTVSNIDPTWRISCLTPRFLCWFLSKGRLYLQRAKITFSDDFFCFTFLLVLVDCIDNDDDDDLGGSSPAHHYQSQTTSRKWREIRPTWVWCSTNFTDV